MRARILVVDDHPATRLSIHKLLDDHLFAVCGEAENGAEAIEKAISLKPDIVVLDINMPVTDGIRAAHEIRRVSPRTKIVFLTIHDVPAFRAAGTLAEAFVSKREVVANLISALNGLAEMPLSRSSGNFNSFHEKAGASQDGCGFS